MKQVHLLNETQVYALDETREAHTQNVPALPITVAKDNIRCDMTIVLRRNSIPDYGLTSRTGGAFWG